METGRECSIEGCNRQVYSRGWCNRHYIRWRRHGDPEGGAAFRGESQEEYFLKRVSLQEGHLIWKGPTDSAGYGQMSPFQGGGSAHRYAWERDNGPIPEGFYVDHLCHTPACVRVDHLRISTPAENSRNRETANSNSQTGLRNIQERNGKFRVRIRKSGTLYHLGTYNSLEEAKQAAKEGREELFGEFSGKG